MSNSTSPDLARRRIPSPWALSFGLCLLAVPALPGCAGHTQVASKPNYDMTVHDSYRLVILRTPNCCRGESARTARALEGQIQLRQALEIVASPAGAEETRDTSQEAQRARGLLAAAREEYLNMNMQQAAQTLQRAQKLVDQHNARGLTSSDLALLQLFSAAVRTALGDEAAARKHFLAAASYDPQLQLDKDLFSPALRQEFARAQGQISEIEVAVQSEPPSAQVFVDGTPIGHTPMKASVRSGGEHYLRVEHPLYAVWEKKINIQPDTSLALQLTPLPEKKLMAATANHQELASAALKLLPVQRIVWLVETKSGLRVDLAYQEDPAKIQTFLLPGRPTQLELQRVVESIEQPGRAETSVASNASDKASEAKEAEANATEAGATAEPGAESTTPDKSAEEGQRQPSEASGLSSAAPLDFRTPSSAEEHEDSDSKRAGFFRRTWWIWAGAGAVVVAVAIIVPLISDSDDSTSPWPYPPGSGRGAIVNW